MSNEIFEIRPRFQKLVPLRIAEINSNINSLLEERTDIVGKVSNGFITINIAQKDQHFWSPQLTMNLKENDEGTLIRGLFGPKPDIWLLFMFLYGLSGFIILIVGIVGLSRYNLGLSAYILWLIPFLLGGVLVLWFSARTGQKLGHDEMQHIYNLIKKNILKNAVDLK